MAVILDKIIHYYIKYLLNNMIMEQKERPLKIQRRNVQATAKSYPFPVKRGPAARAISPPLQDTGGAKLNLRTAQMEGLTFLRRTAAMTRHSCGHCHVSRAKYAAIFFRAVWHVYFCCNSSTPGYIYVGGECALHSLTALQYAFTASRFCQ